MPNKRIRKWRSHRKCGEPEKNRGNRRADRQRRRLPFPSVTPPSSRSPPTDERATGQSGVIRTRAIMVRQSRRRVARRDPVEEEARGDGTDRPADGRVAKERRGLARSILREQSEEVMDGTSVMVQPSISRIPIPLLFIIPCRCAGILLSSGALLFLSLSRIGAAQRAAMTKQRSSGIRRVYMYALRDGEQSSSSSLRVVEQRHRGDSLRDSFVTNEMMRDSGKLNFPKLPPYAHESSGRAERHVDIRG